MVASQYVLKTTAAGAIVILTMALCRASDGGDANQLGFGGLLENALKDAAFEPIDDVLNEMAELAIRQRKAIESLHSWSGRLRLRDRSYYRDDPVDRDSGHFGLKKGTYKLPIVRTSECDGRFEYDFASERLVSEYQVTSAVVTEGDSGTELIRQLRMDRKATDRSQNVSKRGEAVDVYDKTVAPNFLAWCRTIKTPEELLSFRPEENCSRFIGFESVGPKFGRAAFRMAPDLAKDLEPEILNPIRFFSLWGQNPCWLELEEFQARCKGYLASGELSNDDIKAQFNLHKAQIGERVLLRLTITLGDLNMARRNLRSYFFEGVNWLPLLSEVRNSSGRTLNGTFWHYQKSDGNIVPKTISRRTSAGPDYKFLKSERHVEILESRINEPIPEERFGAASLGLREGERLLDRKENKLYVLSEGIFVPAQGSDRDETRVPVPPARQWPVFLLIANVIVLATLGGIILLRRKRRATN